MGLLLELDPISFAQLWYAHTGQATMGCNPTEKPRFRQHAHAGKRLSRDAGPLPCQAAAARGRGRPGSVASSEPSHESDTGGKDPIGASSARCYPGAMNLVLLIIVLLLLFGGGGFYFGGPAIGGGGLGLILIICLIIYLMGGFRPKT